MSVSGQSVSSRLELREHTFTCDKYILNTFHPSTAILIMEIIVIFSILPAVLCTDFKSVPTTVKTYENDTVLLPCYLDSTGKPQKHVLHQPNNTVHANI